VVQNWKLVEPEVPRKMTPNHPAVLVRNILYLQIINVIQIGWKKEEKMLMLVEGKVVQSYILKQSLLSVIPEYSIHYQ